MKLRPPGMKLRRGAARRKGTRPPWVPATSPLEPPSDDCSVVTVDDAVITRFARGPLRATQGPRRWMSGAVHDQHGVLVRESQRMWAGDPNAPVAADPRFVRRGAKGLHLEGSWVYAGHWTRHFGHFLVEVLTNLWPEPRSLPIDGIVAHRSFRGTVPRRRTGTGVDPPELSSWQSELLALAGYGDLEVRVVRHGQARVDRLVVPARPVVLKCWARPPAVDVWRRIAESVDKASDDHVFLSRRIFHRTVGEEQQRVRVSEEWDETLERLFDAAGFRVVHPEQLPIQEQVSIMKGARVVAGSSGSALHMSAFAEPGTRVLEIGDTRSPDTPMPSQRMIDAACGHRSAFVRHGDTASLEALLTDL